jgi:hypothetical protein
MGMGTSKILTTDNIPETAEMSGTLSVGHPSFSVVSSILSVVGIPPVPIPIPEEIQSFMYDYHYKIEVNDKLNIE